MFLFFVGGARWEEESYGEEEMEEEEKDNDGGSNRVPCGSDCHLCLPHQEVSERVL